MSKKYWLPHIASDIRVSANRLSAYLIALEGWRRGLKLTWYSDKVKSKGIHAPGRLFSLSTGEKSHFFYNSKGDLTSIEAQKITGNKELTKEWLSKEGIPVPKGKRFTDGTREKEIIQFANELNYPVVLKPTRGFQGIGVFANIQSEEEFTKALIHLRDDMKYTDVIVEQYIVGTEYRIFVVGENVVGAVEKIPPSIIGDGENNIEELIKKKNRVRKGNPHLYKKPIKVDYEVLACIKEEGYSLTSTLDEGKQIFLRKKNSLSSGGDPVDATDKISDSTKKIAKDTLKAIPDLAQAGLDIIVDEHNDKAAVIEINAIAMIGSHLFPEVGKARDIPSAIIDHYFPETKQMANYYNPMVTFDLKSVLQPLMSKTASKVEVIPAPLSKTHAKKYLVEGNVQNVGYRKWIRKRALEADLFGFAQNLNDGSVSVVVAGTGENVAAFKNICSIGPKNAEVTSITESPWKKPIEVGFAIKEKPVKKNNTIKKSKKELKPSKRQSLFKKIKRVKR